MGLLAFIDDISGRKVINNLNIEVGQLSRGIGIILVMIIGFYFYGPAAILIALMVQPMNIADMQPGTACSTVIIMSLIVGLLLYLTTGTPYSAALIILTVCLGYAPLDYKGLIMMGEVGNHSYAVSLGIIYMFLGLTITNHNTWGVFIIVLILFVLTSILIAYLRRGTLKVFLEGNLNIKEPTFGDYIMDVLTGGGLGDLFRRIILGKRVITIDKQIYKKLGFRRLVLTQ